MKSTSKVSVQKVGGDTFRVNAKRGRSAITGRFVSKATARRNSSTATTEAPKR